MPSEILITGGTGFLGRRLVAELALASDAQLWVLVRSRGAKQRLMKELPAECHDRVGFLRGDVCQPYLGLDTDTITKLARSVTEIWHLAALTSFDESKRAEVFSANVDGTRHVVDLARGFQRLECFYHMSTAYVCGNKQGTIPEGPFDVPEGFKNPYEASKHAAEQLVRSSGLRVAILRPSITLGDSRTGHSGGESRMMYGYAHGIVRAAMHAFPSPGAYWEYWQNGHAGPPSIAQIDARLKASYAVFKNMVTTDDVVSVCLAVREGGAAAGKTYHIVHPQGLSCGEIIGVLQRVAKVTGYVLDPHLAPENLRRGSVVERAAYRYTKLFHPYTTLAEPIWEADNVNALDAPRVQVTEELFEFLMQHHVRDLATRQ